MRGDRRVRGTRATALAVLCLALVACGEDSWGPGAMTAPGVAPASTTAAPFPTSGEALTAPTTPDPVVTAPTTPDPAATASTTPEVAPEEAEVLVERPDGFPNGGERFLIERLDRDVARRCTREPAGRLSKGALAGLDCDTLALFGARSSYELFRSRAAMEAAYGRYREAWKVPVARGQCVPAGGGGSVPGDATWGFGRRSPSEGRVMCYRAGGDVWFVTSIEKIRVLAFARAPRFGAVSRFWRSVGLPTEKPLP